MDKNYLKEYIEFSNEFRKTNGSKESAEKIYDLLYELKNTNRTKQDDLVLSNVYILLGYHRFAYEVFKTAADLKNIKDVSKLYVLEQKAKSHENNFIIKDLRKYREKKKLQKLTLKDFEKKAAGEFKVSAKNFIIFNKSETDEILIYLPDDDIQKYADNIIEHIFWLGDCKKELVEFYNQNNEFTEETADDDWYDSLEIYKSQIAIDDSGNIETLVSVGDQFSKDHILDFEITNRTIVSMNYDG